MALRAGGRRLRFEWWLVALVSTALVVLLVQDRAAVRLNDLIYDSLLRLSERTPSPDILIVAIDNRSLQEIGAWPWPRERHAQLIDRLTRARPKAIGYDVLFVEPGPPGVDARLGQAMAASGSVFVPLLLNIPGTSGAAFDAVGPIDPVRRGAADIGQANLSFDQDGLVRRMFLVEGEGQRQWVQLAELMRRRAMRGAGLALPEQNRVTPQGSLIARHPVGFSYTGPPGHFPTVSAASVLRGEVPPEFLHNRLILVGATADGLGDQYPVALGGGKGVMPGVEIQANLLDAMLTGHLIRPVGGWLLVLVSLLPLWVQLAAFRRLRPRENIILLVVLLAVMTVGTTTLLLEGIWLPPAAAMIGLAFVYPLWGWRRLEAISRYMTDELERFRAEPDPLPHRLDRVEAADLVARQAILLQDSIRRMRDMRRFVSDRLRQLPDATLVCDREGRVLLANERADDLSRSMGVLPDDPGRLQALIARLQYDGRNPTQEQLAEDEADKAVETAGGEALSADGRAFDLRFALQRTGDGALVGWIIRIVDISEAKAAQRQREHVLQLLTHDMRSPQASILAVIEQASAGAIDGAVARRIEGYARRTLTLADDFVQLARAETLEYVMEEIPLGDLLIDAVDDLWPQSSAQGVTIDVEAPDDPIFVRGERSLLTRAFINLIDNGIKYGGDGKSIRCSLSAEAGIVVCTISDQGIGIAPDHLEHLFERFRRAPFGSGERIDGAGLGLTFVRTVITRHRGTIRCTSEKCRGTTFTIELPAIQDA